MIKPVGPICRAKREKGILLATVSLLGAALGVTATTPAEADTENSVRLAHMAAGTQDAMKKRTISTKQGNPKRPAGSRSREPGKLEVPNRK